MIPLAAPSGEGETDWFNGARYVPGTAGVYRRQLNRWMFFSWWNGKQWFTLEGTPRAAANTSVPSRHQDLPFRGLTKEHK